MKLNLGNLSTKELATITQRTITVSAEPAFSVVKDNPLLAALETVYKDYDLVYTKKSFSGKCEELYQTDKKRDNPFSAFKSILVGHSKLSISPYYEQANDIYAIIKKYDVGLDRYTYAEETAQLKKLLDELYLPANLTKIEQMQLTGVLTQIKSGHDAFEKLFNEVAGENAELRLMESATSMRNKLETALRNYFNLIKAMNSQPVWKELYAKLDELAKAVNHAKVEVKAVAQV